MKRLNVAWVRVSILALALLASGGMTPLEAQSTSARIIGRVVQAGTGDPLVGASVSVEGTALAVGTDARGRYLLPRVPAGPWELRVTYIGH